MTRRIFHSILGACLLVLLISFFGSVFSLYQSYVQEQKEQLLRQAELAASLLNVRNTDPEDLTSLDMTDLRITLIEPDGTVYYDSAHPDNEGNHLDRSEIAQARQDGKGFAVRYSDTISEETYNAAIRLKNGGFVRVSMGHSSLLYFFGRALLPMAGMVPLLILCSWLLARLLSRHIVEPINAIDLNEPLQSCPYEQLEPLLVRLEDNNAQIREQMRQLSRKSNEFEVLSQNMDEGLIMISQSGQLIYANKYARRLFDLPQEKEILNNEVLQTLMTKTVDGRKHHSHLKQDGQIYSLEAAPILEDGELIGTLILALDITEKEESHKRRQEFTANVTHELKTPLQTISSSAELLESGMVAKQDIPRFAGYISSEAKRMTQMINDIIHLSRLENESLEENDTTDLSAVVQNAMDKLKSSADVRSIKMSLKAEPAQVRGSLIDVKDIIKNLLENAIVYNVEGGTVDVTITKKDGQAILRVKDTGQGIAPALQNRIFERFFTADPSRRQTGTGLGLAIVSHAVKKLHGKIKVKSAPGKGSTFTVLLPLA